MVVIERIDGAEIFTISFYPETPEEKDSDGQKITIIGYIDYWDFRFTESKRHRFAYIALEDWEYLCYSNEQKKNTRISQVSSLRVLMKTKLEYKEKVDLVIIKRKIGKDYYDFLTKINNLDKF